MVWTSLESGADGRLALGAPLHRYAFGSPLVGEAGIVGIVASPSTAWPVAIVREAAARAPRLTAAMTTGGGR